MANTVTNWASHEEVAATISRLQQAGDAKGLVELCQEARQKFPSNHSYPRIEGDLHFQLGEYHGAARCYVEFLKRISKNQDLFADFASRYYRLRRYWAERHFRICRTDHERDRTKAHSGTRRKSVRSDCPERPAEESPISEEGQALYDLLTAGVPLAEQVKRARKLEATNSAELFRVMDRHFLATRPTPANYDIEAYFLSVYERVGKYLQALKIAEALIPLRSSPVVVATFLRVCRKLDNYEPADRLLERFPSLLKSDSFNILYELVYYLRGRMISIAPMIPL